MQYILGIDSGFTGAVAIYRPSDRWLKVADMPVLVNKNGKKEINHKVLFDLITPVPTMEVQGVLEFVAARPGQSAPATFRFGQGFGAIEMALAAHEIPVTYVTPAKWKKHFKLSKDKGASRGFATQRFPEHADSFARVKDDGRAEAALIALYGAETLHFSQAA